MAFESSDAVLAQLRKSLWFRHQPPALQAALIDKGRIVTLLKGRWLHSEGDLSGGLWAVLSGAMRLEVTVGPDRSVLLNIVGAGVVAGQTLGGGGPRIATVRAAEDSALMLISDAALQQIAAIHPAVWRAVSELLYRQLERTAHLAAEALSLTPRARIAARLLAIARADGVGTAAATLTQADLAEMTGLSRKSVNGHLLALQRQGVVQLVYRGVEVLDRSRLAALTDR
jgi:CRP/FNR family cyclic AMP-dependent transcriptional regulator